MPRYQSLDISRRGKFRLEDLHDAASFCLAWGCFCAPMRPAHIGEHGTPQAARADGLLRQAATPAAVADFAPILQRGVGVGFDSGASTKSFFDELPTVLMRLAKVNIGKISQPMLLIRAIRRECQIVTPMAKIKDKMKMQTLAAPVDFAPAIIFEGYQDNFGTAQPTIPNRL